MNTENIHNLSINLSFTKYIVRNKNKSITPVKINNFVLGKYDNSNVFEIPHKLYGRELELKQLNSIYLFFSTF